MSPAVATRPAPIARAGMQVAGATVLVSLVSYGYGIVLAHLLDGADYAVFAAGQTLLLLSGTAAAAAVPWALAKAVRAHPAGSPERRSAMAYALGVSVVGAVLAGALLGGITGLYAPGPAVLATAIAVAGIVLSGCAVGWLQGELRFARLAVLRVAEVLVRVAAGAAAVAAGLGAAGALGGFLLGSAVLLGGGLAAVAADGRRAWADLSWQPARLRERGRWAETAGLTSAQVLLGVFTATDVVLSPVLAGAGNDVAGFQLAGTLGRAPLFVAAALAVVLYPRLTGPGAEGALRSTARAYGWLGLPLVALLVTVPGPVLNLIVPAHLPDATRLVPFTAVAGLGYGIVTLLITVTQAGAQFRRASTALAGAIGLLACGLLTGWALGGVTGLSAGTCVGAVLAVILVLRLTPLPGGTLLAVAGPAIVALAAVPALLLARRSTPGWLVLAVALGLLALWRARGSRQPMPGDRLRILHLGFEDPALPGSGGGALRTHEMNRRLAERHDITVLTTRWPGCVDRVEDGVRYVHVGLGSGRTYLGRIAGYAVVLPFVSRRYEADLVVEDFFAPISTMGAPLWTGRPTIGLVQWLNAKEKSRQYKLPFFLVERAGVRAHHRLIAVSDGIAERLRGMNPAVRVDVVGNGVDPAAFEVDVPRGADVVFVGRLEIAQKGLDLLLTAFAAERDRLTGDLVLAGTGPDERRLRALAEDLGIVARVRFAGWVSGAEKYELLGSAGVVAVPSRFETFGIVAVEALASGSPVVAFDIPCLREVVPGDVGVRVPEFDVTAYGRALVEVAADPERLGVRGREFARTYSWDRLALDQERTYVSAARPDQEAAHVGPGH
ncbi:glycosyltransferase [Amycolatopsis sp. H20-H5]|uniref:glycosyltransferase n=1 Tax=Amycolatopsis sp. H20-H5 TaxID=3046309 RepID=UPI002DB7BDB7|nr:glycosyltransferase [Amycolatopsis sp. H20-H5]MEC3982065.1 glycosyltransferase [Amycolatopsis sp. H20-H5]